MTTMALSTSIPAPNASPPNVMILMDNPLKYIRLNVAIMEIGIETLTIKVMFIRLKKTYKIITANKIPKRAESFTSLMELPIKSP